MARRLAYDRIAAELRVAPEDLAALEREVRVHYPGEDMLSELRTLHAVRERWVTLTEAIAEFRVENERMASAG